MNETPWTPGPWVARPRHANMIDVTHNVKTPGAITHALCRVQARASWVEEATANARLIAAAPEMAEALECLAAMAAHFPTVKTYGNRPRSGAIYSVSDMHLGEAAITVEDLHRAAALLSRIRGDVA